MNPERYFQKFSLYGSFAPKIWNRKSVKQAPHSEQAIGHGMQCREIRFTPRCSPRAREFPRLVNFCVRRTVAELRDIKVGQFSDFGLFSPYKTPKTYLSVTSLQPRGYIGEWLRFFDVVVEGPKRCLRAPEYMQVMWILIDSGFLCVYFDPKNWPTSILGYG